MAADKSPLVLFHPWLLSGGVWQDVVPLVSGHHEVFTPTALGHRGGPQVQSRPVRIWDVIEAAETYLDEQGLQRPHLAGNSLGGFVALELARRGRAATVCALSPAGFSATGDGTRAQAARRGRRIATASRLTGPAVPLVFKSPLVRRIAWRVFNVARHGDRLPAGRVLELNADVVACTVTKELFSTDDEQVAPMDPLPCPITIAWSEKDTLIPLTPYGGLARQRLPKATFTVLPDVGHVPMVDDPALVARTILESTRAVNSVNGWFFVTVPWAAVGRFRMRTAVRVIRWPRPRRCACN
jgi:pimeloyl-ACP methyl ester carboxylesterase